MPSHTRLLPAALVLAAGLIGASPAAAKDRNHDRIPDRWEQRHHLSLAKSQARRDQDRDGLRNLGEYRAGLNPRKADTDGDGIEDGDENAGTIASFSGGVLTITLAGGGTLSGAVTERTEIECGEDAKARSSSHGDDDDADEDRSGRRGGDDDDDERGDDDEPDTDEDRGDDEDEDEDKDRCDSGDLVAGTPVHEASLKITSAGAVWREVELGRSSS